VRENADTTVIIASFLLLLTAITASGAMAFIRKRKTPEDYLVASRRVPPWLSALSTVATNNSGFMFIGMIAYAYRIGVQSVWMMVGWIVGDLLMWIFVHPGVRRLSARHEVASLPGLVAMEPGGRPARPVAVVAGLVTVVFLAVYAAAQLKAGSTALHVLFDWDMSVGALIGTGIVILYSYAGGIRADIWTDAAQSFVMILAMGLILAAGVDRVGGPVALAGVLEAQDPALTRWMPRDLTFGFAPFVVGFTFAGMAAAGQPHLMTRIMSIGGTGGIRRAGFYYFGWFIPFFIASIGVGLYTRAILPDLESLAIARELEEPTELALPLITLKLLPDVVVGVALAGLFAATVSTADSQLIVCSGALTQDVRPRWQDSYLATKAGTLSVTAIALGVALFAPEGVFSLVLIAWSALGASLAPILAIRLLRWPLTVPTALGMMTAATLVVAAWHLSPFDDDVLEALPGALAAGAVYGVGRLVALRRG
jgi:sodium/proline symporter